ncbi:MAG TPA: VOC family protein [Bacteroidota bacterium]|nr:VOC family protein [Bacteroidota bacterium]
MSALQGLRTVIYHVNNIEKAKEWYTRILGFPPYFDQPFYVGFNVGGYELGLDPNMKGVVEGSNVVAYWGVKDAREEYNRLLQLGAKEEENITDVGEGIIVGTVRDPFGNVFGIIQNPHFKLPSNGG